jgi:hypothetical protein
MVTQIDLYKNQNLILPILRIFDKIKYKGDMVMKPSHGIIL